MTDYRERLIIEIANMAKERGLRENKLMRSELSHLNFEELKGLLTKLKKEN